MGSYAGSQLAATLGLLCCTVFTTMNSTLNYIAFPSYLLPPVGVTGAHKKPHANPDLILRQWELSYSSCNLVGPGAVVFGTLFYLYAALTAQPERKTLFFIAAASAAVAFPYTVVFLLPTNNELYRRADLLRLSGSGARPSDRRADEFNGVDTMSLIQKSLFLSKFRALMPVPAILVTLLALTKGH